jgi:hypothetical protein
MSTPLDGKFLLHHHLLNRKAAHLHPQHVGGSLGRLIGRLSKADATQASPASHPGLDLHHDRPTNLSRDLSRLAGRAGHPALGYRNTLLRQKRFTLIFV